MFWDEGGWSGGNDTSLPKDRTLGTFALANMVQVFTAL